MKLVMKKDHLKVDYFEATTEKETRNLLTIEHLNAQSILAHIEEIELLLIERKIDILCVSETWLDASIQDSFIHILDFNVYRCDHGRGGGTLIYVRNDLKVNIIFVDAEKADGIEDVWISVQHKKLPSFIIGCVYQHPKALASSFDYLSKTFKNICLRKKPVFILGDMNEDFLTPNDKIESIDTSVKSLSNNK